jgi:predicted DNA-binding transcriptional regulator YafY
MPTLKIGAVRLLQIARHLVCSRKVKSGGQVTVEWIQQNFGVAPATAKRDLQLVRMYFPVSRVKTTGKRHRRIRLRMSDRVGPRQP